MLLEAAIGDAFGAGWEFATSNLSQNTGEHYIKHPSHNILPGAYTDDAQMSIAVAEAMLEAQDKNKKLTRKLLSDKFVECFKRDERLGYSGAFYYFLKSVNDGKEFLTRIKSDSKKCGAAMRAAPIGYYKNITDVIEYSSLQACLTHNTCEGIQSSLAVSLMAHYFIYNLGKKKDAVNFVNDFVPGKWSEEWSGKVDVLGIDVVHAAISAIQKYDNLKDILVQCVDYTGDVDSVACIAMACASCSKEIENNLPQRLYDELENGKYGKDYLISLDKRLF